MHPSRVRALHDVTNEILERLQMRPRQRLRIRSDHGLDIEPLSQTFYHESCVRHALSPNDVCAEIVRGRFAFRHEPRVHKESCLHATCLGPREYFPPAAFAQVLFSEEWLTFRSTDSVLFHPNAKHSFTVGENGTLFYLSVRLRAA